MALPLKIELFFAASLIWVPTTQSPMREENRQNWHWLQQLKGSHPNVYQPHILHLTVTSPLSINSTYFKDDWLTNNHEILNTVNNVLYNKIWIPKCILCIGVGRNRVGQSWPSAGWRGLQVEVAGHWVTGRQLEDPLEPLRKDYYNYFLHFPNTVPITSLLSLPSVKDMFPNIYYK